MITCYYMDTRQTTALILGGLIALGIICFLLLGFRAFKRDQQGTAKSFGLMFQRGNFLHLVTVLLVVACTTFLGLAEVIKDSGIISVLSGVAGYVLGGMKASKGAELSSTGKAESDVTKHNE
jgi:hypothetical protein